MRRGERLRKGGTPLAVYCAASRDERGAAAVELALILPFLLFALLAIIQFGLALNNYMELTDGVRAGARQFAISRSGSTPYTTARSAVTASAVNLTASNVTITLRVNGTTCSSDSACSTALSAASGGSATVSATYPCNLTVMNVNFATGCTLSSQTTELIE